MCATALLATNLAHAQTGDVAGEGGLLSRYGEVLLLRDYNTRVVVTGVSLLGAACGVVGTFTLLRKRALLADALSHAMLPGIGIAFLLMAAAGGTGKWLPGLLAGAAISGVVSVLVILGIVRTTRIREDAALGIVLSVFFGLGTAVLGVVQRSGAGSAAGLNTFIYGKTAAMLWSDAVLIGVTAVIVTAACVALFRDLELLCFDAGYARTLGRPTALLDVLLMGLVVTVTVVGLQAVGLILVIALLVIPAAAARFWSERLPVIMAAAAAIGAASGFVGAAVSAVHPRLPAGALIVLVGGGMFVVSLLFGPARGVLRAAVRRWGLSRRVARQHLLRAIHELQEQGHIERPAARGGHDAGGAPLAALRRLRSWGAGQPGRALRAAQRDGLVEVMRRECGPLVRLTPSGRSAAERIVRNHRLWELYLISHADIAPSHVDRDADMVEHVLGPAMIAELEARLVAEGAAPVAVSGALPASPHPLDDTGAPR
ncbi:MAG: metal ABC transporter permease [Phycisphaerales bacterium]|nr:metal ABC transporter permease [Phycisphaerales bacterium]